MTLRSLAGLVAGVIATGAAAGASAPKVARPSRQYTIEQFMNTVDVFGASFSPDEARILFTSNKTGIFNAYIVPVRGGEPTAVTTSTADTTLAISFFRTDDRVLYTRDHEGNERNHLYVRTLDGQECDLTPGENVVARFIGWATDGTAFYAATNERDPRFFDAYRYDAATYARTLFYKNDQPYSPTRVSGDGAWLSLTKVNASADSDLYVWNAETKAMAHVSPHERAATYSAAAFDPGSTYLYYLTNDGSEFKRLRRYALKTAVHEDVEKRAWDITSMSFSASGRYRITGINEDGRWIASVFDTQTGKRVALPAPPGQWVRDITISRSEKRVALDVQGDRAPEDLYVHDLGGTTATRLTTSLSREVDPDDLVEGRVVRFPSFDKLAIPSIFYKPHQASPAQKAPAVVLVHGGPGGQSLRGYSALSQYLANHGYVVLAINNRGSSGYGRRFFTADDQKHGKEPLWDCVEGKKYLASLPYVDPDRIAIVGGSYGGYMALAALTFQPDVFAAGVDMFGISNWVRTLENMPAWWEAERVLLYSEIGNPATQKEMLREISPLFHAERIRKPLLVIQGANDQRVLKAESDDIVAAVKKNGVPVEYIVFTDEGHGFAKTKSQIETNSAVLRFLDAHLKPALPPKPSEVFPGDHLR